MPNYFLLILDPETLFPENDVPRYIRYRAIWYMAMVYLGLQSQAGRQLRPKLKAEAAAYLSEVNEHAFQGTVQESAITKQLGSAWKICTEGRNNLIKTLAANDNGAFQLAIKCRG